ncbi:MAG: T9SS type A sorting domain-containing protein [Saprospiraceae bacterium]|nr:T9SS type A sorting domain-containing protein [Saprospiraceae bacterium]
MYQTLDGNWDGPLDSSICISLKSNTNEGIDLHTVDLTKPIFLRNRLTEDNKQQLQPNYIYSASASIWNSNNNEATLLTGINCSNNFCSGLIVGIQIPDETGNSTNMRWYMDIPGEHSYLGDLETCLPTEYFDENYLREYIVKLTLSPGTTPDMTLRMSQARITAFWSPYHIDKVVAPPFTFEDTSYNVPLYLVGYQVGPSWSAPNYLLLYTDSNSYPSSSTPAYVEAQPSTNTADPKTINLIVSEWETLVPQPFAFLRGALVEGSDSIRHQVNLVNHAGDICMPGPIDFVIEDNTKYIHAGGHVNFEGTNSCMMFRNGGTLEVADGVTMQYGQDGRGIMALRSGGKMKLGKGSTLLFDGLLWLQGIPTEKHPDPQFYLDLKPGMSLVFGENAHITNAMSTSPDVKLNVYMNGGTLDDSKLNANARNRINRIYPKPSKHFTDNVRLLQNPAIGGATISYTAAGQERVLVQVYDLQGKLAWSKTFEATEGLNSFEVGMGEAVAGVYMATVSANGGRASMKIVRI